MRRFTRLTNAFSKKVENLTAAVSLHFAHYNYRAGAPDVARDASDGSAGERSAMVAAMSWSSAPQIRTLPLIRFRYGPTTRNVTVIPAEAGVQRSVWRILPGVDSRFPQE